MNGPAVVPSGGGTDTHQVLQQQAPAVSAPLVVEAPAPLASLEAPAIVNGEGAPNFITSGASLHQQTNDTSGVLGVLVNSAPTSNIAHLFVLTGQSNAVGAPMGGSGSLATLPSGYSGAQSNLKIWWEGSHTTPITPTFVNMECNVNTAHPDYTDPVTGNRTGQWGFEQQLSRDLYAHYGQTIYVVKSAYGGRSIEYWNNPSLDRWGELENYITGALAWCSANGKTPVFHAIVWVQGEQDAYEGNQGVYATKLRTVIARIRGLHSSLATTPFIMVKLRTDSNLGSGANNDAISAAMDQVATDPNCYAFDPEAYPDMTFYTDGLHYNAAGLVAGGGHLYDFMVARGLLD
jgi:hypothetical protein